MKWLKDPIGDNHPKVGFIYRLTRRFTRALVSVWFREIDLIDSDNLPTEGGLLFIAWHPSGLIDPMLMHASLPGKQSMIAKHTLFKIPVLGRFIKAAGALPIERSQDSDNREAASNRNKNQLSAVSSAVANGGRLIIFPEGTTHTEASSKQARSGAARIIQAAIREAEELGKPRPQLVPIGLHYSDATTFRERCAVVIERPMTLPQLPEIIDDFEVQDKLDREWVTSVTKSIDAELKRASLSKTSWEERELIWRGKGVVHAERARQMGESFKKPTYYQSVLGARRIRAAQNEPKKTAKIVENCTAHFANLDDRGISPLDVDSKPERMSTSAGFILMVKWSWAAVWMFGLITWSAVIGNMPAYQANYLLMHFAKKSDAVDKSVLGTYKVLAAVITFPIWWVTASLMVTWALLAEASPVNELLSMHYLLEKLTHLPFFFVFLIFMYWWPNSAKLHLKLYGHLVRSHRSLKRWSRWSDDEIDWDSLQQNQQSLAQQLTQLGDGLVLPGDPDWVEPQTGMDDFSAVSYR
jgi:1-acyl-sn-glycerol-3-phosphate acyltransferase